jgi:hypothetical protein
MKGLAKSRCGSVSYQLKGQASFSPADPLRDTPVVGKNTMVAFAVAPRATLTVTISVFISSMALQCIVISVSLSASSFF